MMCRRWSACRCLPTCKVSCKFFGPSPRKLRFTVYRGCAVLVAWTSVFRAYFSLSSDLNELGIFLKLYIWCEALSFKSPSGAPSGDFGGALLRLGFFFAFNPMFSLSKRLPETKASESMVRSTLLHHRPRGGLRAILVGPLVRLFFRLQPYVFMIQKASRNKSFTVSRVSNY